MKYNYIFLVLSFLALACQETVNRTGTVVNNFDELDAAIKNAQPGDEIVMADGTWKDVRVRFIGKGTANNPITLRAETPGKVIIGGKSDLKFGGEYLVVEGLHFKGGYTPSQAIIEFRIDENTIANHCRVTHCVIEDFNQLQRDRTDLWVQFRGRHNQRDHCYRAGKSNRGPTVRVDIEGNESIKNYHKITNNHFGPRPPKGGPSAETIQLGNSFT
ncbi:MAG: alginate lyase, partial [Cytophagales bacterium]|nr:alginate lyase [Cytophagales bacterium]